MKAITLWQPWASLIAVGAKQIETRSWKTNYRGPLAIHAAKVFRPEDKNLWVGNQYFLDALEMESAKWILKIPEWLPVGCIVATCDLIDCIEIKDGIWNYNYHSSLKVLNGGIVYYGEMKLAIIPPGEPEHSFGNYTPGRYAWILSHIKIL